MFQRADNAKNISASPRATSFLEKPGVVSGCFALLTMLAGIGAYYKMFTGFGAWDDEGTLMVSVKQYLGGLKLYQQIISSYGPVYYIYNWLVRSITATQVTHNVVGFSSILPWLLSALACAFLVLRETRSLLLSCVTHIAVFSLLSFFANEPGHPQELCILLLTFLVVCGFAVASPRWRRWGIASIGVLTAALLLVKINIGIFMMLAVSLALLAYSPKRVWARVLLFVAGTGSIVLPVVLMKAHVHSPQTQFYIFVVEASLIAMLMAMFQFKAPEQSLSLTDIVIATASFIVTVAGVLLILLLHGISMNSIFYSLVLSNFKVSVSSGFWYMPLLLGWKFVAWAIVGLSCALLFVWKRFHEDESLWESQIAWLKISVALISATAVLLLKYSLFPVVAPFVWLVLYDPSQPETQLSRFPRTLLCSAAVFQTLYAYPIAGSQKDFIQVLMVPVIMIWIGDFFLWRERSDRKPFLSRSFIHATALILLASIPLAYLGIDYHQRRFYNSIPSLGIGGADRIHLPAKRIRDYHWLVENLKANCDVFVGLPEIPSLHIWTSKDSVAGLYLDAWILSATKAQQTAAIRELSSHPSACAVYNPDLVAFWNRGKQDVTQLPLVHYIETNFKVAGASDRYFLLVKNERSLTLNASPVQTLKFYEPGQ